MPTPARWSVILTHTECTECGEPLAMHDCNCVSCPRRGRREAFRCTSSCYQRGLRLKDRKTFGEKAGQAWANHTVHGRFCSKRCHDKNARHYKQVSRQLESQYQWLKHGKVLEATLRAARPQTQRASSSRTVASGRPKISATS